MLTFKNKTSTRYPILGFMTDAKNINFCERAYSKQNCMFAIYPTIVQTAKIFINDMRAHNIIYNFYYSRYRFNLLILLQYLPHLMFPRLDHVIICKIIQLAISHIVTLEKC